MSSDSDRVTAREDDLRACAAFRGVAEALAEGRALEPVLHLIAEKLCELTGRVRCSIHLMDPETGLLRGRAAHAPTDIEPQVRRLVSGGRRDGFTRKILTTRRPVTLVDALSDPNVVRAAMQRWNARSVLGAPMVLHDELIGIVVLDDESTVGTFSEGEQELVATFADLAATAVKQAQLTSRLQTSFAKVASQMEQLQQAAEMEERLTGMVLRGSTLRQIGHSVADLLGKPCAIYSANFQRLVFSPGGISGGSQAKLLDPNARAIPAVADQLASLKPGEPDIIEPAPWAGVHHRILVSAVTLDEQHWGYVAVGEYGARLNRLDNAVVRRAATSIALERAGERRAAEAEWHTVEAFTGSLLRGEESPVRLERRAEVLGARLDVPRVVCVVGMRDGGGPGLSSQVFARLLTGPESPSAVLGAPSGEDVALILELPDGLAPRQGVPWAKQRLQEALARVEYEGELFAAVSAVASEPGDDARAYSEAKQVLATLRQHLFVPGNQVLSIDDLGAGRLLLASTNAAEARRFGYDALGPLLGADQRSRELLNSLAAFVDGGRSVRRAAHALGVHTNTIRYRLATVAKLTGLEITTDPQSQLTAQFALLVLRLEGYLPLLPTGADSGAGDPDV